MLEQLAAAFDRQDYKMAAMLLRQLQQEMPGNPWVGFYAGRLREVAGDWKNAELAYRKVLQETTNPKVAIQARQGVQRVAELLKEKRAAQLAEATLDPTSSESGVLILDVIEAEQRQSAAQAFARIMKIDAYAARLLLPSRGWRLYRVGPIGELQLYGQELQEAGIPAFWLPLQVIQDIRVFRVHYIQSISPQVSIVCENESGQLGSLSCRWSEIANRIEGRLPIFEEVVDTSAWNQLTRKEKTQDYAQVIDLHLPKRNCILRFGDWNYQFQQGVVFDAKQDGELPMAQSTNRQRWNQLVYFLDDCLSMVPVWAEFAQFGETAMDPLSLVKDLPSHLNLFRKAPSKWDLAFQLYSGLILARSVRS